MAREGPRNIDIYCSQTREVLSEYSVTSGEWTHTPGPKTRMEVRITFEYFATSPLVHALLDVVRRLRILQAKQEETF